MKTLINYTFNDHIVMNPDGSFSTSVHGARIRMGPGDTSLGHYEKALDLGSTGKAVVDIQGLKPDRARFCVRMVFKVAGPVTTKQTLVESNLLPFSLFVDKGTKPSNFTLHAQVKPTASVWAGASTGFKKDLQPGTWYTAGLVYDSNTVAVFIDDELVSVYAFPKGAIKVLGGSKLFIGIGSNGKGHLAGSIAALQWDAGIPAPLASLVDERRSDPEWFITYKFESLRGPLALGDPLGPMAFDAAVEAYTQQYEWGAIQYHDGVGAAFEMHGAIHQLWVSLAGKADLGYLVSDEGDTAKPGGRKNIFSNGAVYWSPATGAIPVTGQLYLDYEAMEESKTLGFPVTSHTVVPGGVEQVFEGGRMYHKDGSGSAHEVHGDILSRFLGLGGVWTFGFPITNESDVMRDGKWIGRFSEFEGCTIYWSPSTGAHEVHGDIRRKYRDEMGGPAGQLGFPTSDESDIPGVSGPGRFNTFQQGSILWYGSWSSMVVAFPFTVFVGRIDSKESEGAFMGQNDLYTRITLRDGPNTVYDKRHPSSGDWGGRNIVDLDLNIPAVIVPNVAGKVVTLVVDVWESDDGAPFGGGDDHLGTWTKTLAMANGWGLRENGGILNSGSFSDVDSDSEWWDITDWVEKAFYELVVDSLAGSGNCFGMSLEAINARKGASLFGLPLDRFTSWDQVRNEFNIKHCYQVGSGPIWWFLDQFISGNTHDPTDVFNRTWQEASRGNQPVLCLAQNYDFSGAPHCVLPVGWDNSSKPWHITICDPNFPKQLRDLTVDPDRNTFRYVGASTYEGGEWTGGRLHYMPYDLVCSAPHTPVWDAILLILAGTIVILGDDTQTVSITDLNGNDLDAYGERARRRLQSNQRLDGFFVGFKGYDRSVSRSTHLARRADVASGRAFQPKPKGTIAGEVLVRRFAASRDAITDPVLSGAAMAHASIAALTEDRRFRPLAAALARQPAALRALAPRTVSHVANDDRAMATLDREARGLVGRLASLSRTNDFVHTIQAVRQGNLSYTMKHGLSEIRLHSSVSRAENTEVQMRDPGTSKHAITVKAGTDKSLTVQIENKLGVGNDRFGMTVSDIPLERAGQVEINARPGIGGVDVVAGGGQRASANVSIDAKVDGRSVKRSFAVPIEGGIRVNPASVLAESRLDVSRIDRLFGPALSREWVRRNP